MAKLELDRLESAKERELVDWAKGKLRDVRQLNEVSNSEGERKWELECEERERQGQWEGYFHMRADESWFQFLGEMQEYIQSLK